jgi:hypothetical protein
VCVKLPKLLDRWHCNKNLIGCPHAIGILVFKDIFGDPEHLQFFFVHVIPNRTREERKREELKLKKEKL